MKLSELHKLEHETKGSLARNMMAASLRVSRFYLWSYRNKYGFASEGRLSAFREAAEKCEIAVHNAFTNHAKEFNIVEATLEDVLAILIKEGIVIVDGKPYKKEG